MAKAYAVTYDGKLSNLGFATIELAIEYVQTRYNEPTHAYGWVWIDLEGKEYRIHELKVDGR